jgi:Lon protease-like protein
LTKHTILFLAANPLGTDRLALDREARAIQVELARSGDRNKFDLVTCWAAEPLDLLRELRKLKPTVVHFSGHGCCKSGRLGGEEPHRDVVGEPSVFDGDHQHGLFFQGPDGRPTLVSSTALAETFGAAGSSVKVIVLNACYSEAQAKALLAHIDCVVGISGSIRDAAARNFAIGFYGGLGERESVAAAYRQGRAAISLEGLPDGERPQLKLREGIDAERFVLTEDVSVQCTSERELFATESAEHTEDRTPTLADQARISSTPALRSSEGPTCPVPPILAVIKDESAKIIVVFQATMREFDAQVIARVTAELQRLTGDLTVRVLRVEEGSVRLTLEMTNSTALKLLQMQHDGTLDDICGINIIEVIKILSENDEPNRGNQVEIVTRNQIPASRRIAAPSEVANAFVDYSTAVSNSALESLPIFPLPNYVLLPGGLLPLHVFEAGYREMMRDCLEGHRLIGVARLRPGYESSYYGRPPVFEKCGVGRIICSEELPDGRLALILRGVARAEIARELPWKRSYRVVEATAINDTPFDPVDAQDHHRRLIHLCDRLADVIEQGRSLRDLVRSFDSPGACADAVAAALVMDADARQELLEARDPMIRLQRTLSHVSHLLCELAPSTKVGN